MGILSNWLDSCGSNLYNIYADAEDAILADMARRIATYDYCIPAAQYQKKVLEEMGATQEYILSELSRRTEKTQQELKQLMQEAGMEAVQSDRDIYQRNGIAVPDQASDMMQNILASGYQQTLGTFQNLTRTTAVVGTAQFRRELDIAWLMVSSGGMSLDQATRTAIKRLSVSGLDAVSYTSGKTLSLDAVVRMTVRTGINQTAAKIQLQFAAEMDSDLVEVTAHAGARPSHAEWQGKVYSISGKTKGYRKLEDATGYGSVDGLCGANCRHNFFPFFEGESSAYSKKELEEYTRPDAVTYNGKSMSLYEAQQLQRYHERQIRRWKRENVAMQAAGQGTTESAVKLRSWQERQKDFLKQTGFKPQSAREQITSFGRSQATKATKEAETYYQLWSKSIGVNDAVKTLAKYYDIKYNSSPTYKLLQRYAQDVEAGWISPNANFGNYLKQYDRIQEEIVGTETKNGILITGQSRHFMQRVLGTGTDPGHGGIARSGVSIDNIIDTLQNGIVRPVRPGTNGGSQKFIGSKCDVSVNPKTGILIQCNSN
ncbi:MAG: phage minor capsid protein [Clostridia bacterium]|nr:phage minor capsid protein [Clostridia bacterium]